MQVTNWGNCFAQISSGGGVFLQRKNVWTKFLITSDEYPNVLGMLCLKVTSAAKQQLLKMCHLKHRLRIFLSWSKIIFRSQGIQVFVFLTIIWFTKSASSRWVLVHETTYIFEHIFWTTTHEVTKLNAKNKFWGVPHLLHMCVIFSELPTFNNIFLAISPQEEI